MGDPACYLNSVCLSCGRFLEAVPQSACPHCGEPISGDEPRRTGPVVATDHVNTILYCDAFTPTVDFYRRLLGLTVMFANEWFVEFKLRDRASVSIVDASRTTIPAVAGRGMTLSLKVDDLDGVRARLLESGIEATSTSQRFGSDAFDIHDPEGHRIEFWSG